MRSVALIRLKPLRAVVSGAVLAALTCAPVHAQVTSPTTDQSLLDAARAGAAGAQMNAASGAGVTTPLLPGSVDPMLYRVGPGDVLQLVMWGKVSRTETLEIGPEGTIMVPGVDVFDVRGLTLNETKDRVLQAVRRETRDVKLDLRLIRPRRFLVQLTGEVKAPGPVEATASTRVSDVLPPAALTDVASRRHIEVISRSGARTIADMELFYRTGDPALNPFVTDGDVLFVPIATEFVFVAGAVASPGRFELGPNDSLRTLLRIAGDPLPSASEDRVLLIRWPEPFRAESLWVSLSDIYSGSQNPPLRDGERVYLFFVPQYHDQREAMIEGEVARPGAYPISEGHTRLSDLVRSAGGFLPTADLASVRVRRVSATSSEHDPELDRLLRLSRNELTSTEYVKMRTRLAGLREEYRVDWNRIESGGPAVDLLLKQGDEVRVERLVSSIRIDGEVRRPAILQYRAGAKVDDYVREAGGFGERAWKGKVRVTRAVTGQTLLANDVPSVNPGDFIWVPEKPDVTFWSQLTTVLTPLSYAATIVIAVVTVQHL